MRLNFGYDTGSGFDTGSMEATLPDALSLFARFSGASAVMYLVLSDTSSAVWHKHGPLMFEVRVRDHVERRYRMAQLANALAEDCIRRTFAGTLDLRDFEAQAFLYAEADWDPNRDPDYWSGRSRSWPKQVEPWGRD